MNAARTILSVVSAVLVAAAAANAGPGSIATASPKSIQAVKPVAQTSTLTVKVIDENGAAVADALVMIDSEHALSAHAEKYSDAKGRADFNSLRSDNYLVCVLTEAGIFWEMIPVKGGKAELTIKVATELPPFDK